jgi:hypothetical protein
MVSSKPKNGFNSVSCGTHRARSSNEDPAQSDRGGVSGTLRGAGFDVRTPSKKHLSSVAIPQCLIKGCAHQAAGRVSFKPDAA